jgi:uncharacterized membrane protein
VHQGFLSRFRKEPFLWSSIVVAGLIYAFISLVNHYCFRTYTLDLGAYTSALYDYAHFNWNDSTSFKAIPENLLADHFDLYLPLFSPLIYIFGTYTLLVVQLVAVLFGAVGIYRYFEFTFPKQNTKRFALYYFLLFFGVFASFSFDYHSNVVASMLVPWLFLAFKKQQIKHVIIWSILILIAKENMSLWLIFIGFGLAFLHRSNKKMRLIALGIAGFSIIYFIVITGVVMPALSRNGAYPHFHYAVLGPTSGAALIQLVSHPIDSFFLLFQNHSGNPSNDYVKTELWVVLFVSGFFCIRKPIYCLMLIPIFAQKLYHDNVAMWGINQHYAIEFAPILAIGTFEVLGNFSSKKWVLFLAVIVSFATGIRVMDNTVAYAEKARIRIYKAAHYNREFSIKRAYEVLDKIPNTAAVSAQGAFLPHLALRDEVYQFPIIRNATYILLSKVENPYPLDPTSFTAKFDSLKASNHWVSIVDEKEFLLLKRVKK